MELVKIGKDKYLVKGSRGVIISEEERVKMGITIDGKGCENCFKKKEEKEVNKENKKSKKKAVKKEVEEIVEEEKSFVEDKEESEVDTDDIIEETTETI